MSDEAMTLYAAVLRLSRSDVKALKISDAYSVSKVSQLLVKIPLHDLHSQ